MRAAKQTPGQVLSAAERRAAARAVAPEAAPPKESKSIDPAPLVDRLGELDEILRPHRAAIKEEETLRSTVRGLADDKTSHVHGAKFTVVLGPRANETIVAYYELAKKIGLDKYAQIATATLKALGKAVPAGILAHYCRTQATGTRPLMVIAKEQAAA